MCLWQLRKKRQINAVATIIHVTSATPMQKEAVKSWFGSQSQRLYQEVTC